MALKPAVAYARMSLDQSGTGLGVERQLEAITEYAKTLGLRIVQTFTDNDISATTGKRRPGFEALLAAQPDVVVVWQVDRLARVSKDLERILELGCTVHSIQAGHVDLSTPSGKAVARTLTAWATYEGDIRTARQQLALQQRAVNGKPWWPVRPLGYNRDGTMHPVEGPALARAYDTVVKGGSLSKAARDLNAEGIRTARGNEWTGVTIRAVLTNPRNAGISTYQGEEVGKGNWDPIVSQRTLRALVRALDAPARKTGALGRREGLLTGWATCGKCGGNVRIATRKYKDNSYQVYSCRDQHCATVRRKDADTEVLARCIMFLESDWARDLWAKHDNGDEAATAHDAVRSIEIQMVEWQEDRTAGRVTRAQFIAANEDLMGQLADAKERLATAAPDLLPDMPSPEYVFDYVMAMSTDERRAQLRRIFSVQILPSGRGRNLPVTEKVRVKAGEVALPILYTREP